MAGYHEQIIKGLSREIALLLNDAARITETASAFGAQGLSQRTIEILFEAEPLIRQAKTLLEAAAITHRRCQRKSAAVTTDIPRPFKKPPRREKPNGAQVSERIPS